MLKGYFNVIVMGKVSFEDKLRIQTLREQRLGAKSIVAAYPDKGWSVRTVNKICSGHA